MRQNCATFVSAENRIIHRAYRLEVTEPGRRPRALGVRVWAPFALFYNGVLAGVETGSTN